MSIVHYFLALCLLCAQESAGYQQKGSALQLERVAQTVRAYTQQSLKQKFVEHLFQKLLQRTSLAETEQRDPWHSSNEDVAEDEADQLSAVTRYVGVGYNLLKGSPDGDFDQGGKDPGILATHEIFDFTYDEGKDVFFNHEEVKVPDQVNVQPLSSCSSRSQKNAYSGAKSYQKSLGGGVGLGGKKLSLPTSIIIVSNDICFCFSICVRCQVWTQWCHEEG